MEKATALTIGDTDDPPCCTGPHDEANRQDEHDPKEDAD